MSDAAHGISETTTGGLAAFALTSEAAGLRLTVVPGAGMVCSSLLQGDRELLHVGDGLAAYVAGHKTFGVPLLHPWANRLERLGYEAAGRRVRLDPARSPIGLDGNGLTIHGLTHASTHWKVARAEANAGGALLAARLDVTADPAVAAGFPFPHVLELVITLRHGELSWELTLTATGGVSVPISFGWHPYLRIPGVPRQEWQIELPVVRQAMLDGRGLPTGQTRPAPMRSGALGERAFDDLFPVLDDPAEFVVSGGDGALRVRFDEGWRCAQVYTPPGGDFICFEPMTAPTDALRRGGAALRLAGPGESFTSRWSLLVEGRPGA